MSLRSGNQPSNSSSPGSTASSLKKSRNLFAQPRIFMVNGSYPSLADAKSLLERDGKHPVFLHINARKKGPEWTGWAKITHAETLSPDYQRLLCSKPNTGILLGEPSDNLCAFD